MRSIDPRGIPRHLVEGAFRGLGFFPVKLRGIRFRVDPYHIGFWKQVGSWEPRTFDILDEFLKEDSTFIDVGAWIGPITLFAATRARHVFSIEPDYIAYQCLLMNLQLNRLKNVMPFNLAVGGSTGPRRMSVIAGMMGNSLTRLEDPDPGAEQFGVSGISWSDWLKVADPGRPSLIKIDVEGAEFELLPAMKEYLLSVKPPLLLSIHLPFLPEGQRERRSRGLFEVISIYKRCLDDRRQQIDLAMLSRTARDDFMSVLLTD